MGSLFSKQKLKQLLPSLSLNNPRERERERSGGDHQSRSMSNKESGDHQKGSSSNKLDRKQSAKSKYGFIPDRFTTLDQVLLHFPSFFSNFNGGYGYPTWYTY
ncbi:hypothetical protein COLO4_24991 [Corchorus olitorius]|uniref:Uncharacterized protein n=1 Tax=Corchorus olitorius TaxID=93759 RepID=A0A1R3I5I8_9ROSI|nr:hypothetical protein COLO4_24991 [Corchorus olitorius]